MIPPAKSKSLFPLTTVAKELVAALSGLVLVLFVLAHMAGNFLVFIGPASYNSYAEHLHSGIQLSIARVVLIAAFVAHGGCTLWLALDNRRIRRTPYAVSNTMGGTNLAKWSMIYSGIAVLVFVSLHLCDFAFREKTGAASILDGKNEGLYGLVCNSFRQPTHVVFYVLSVGALGLHLSNVISTLWVTLGVLTHTATNRVNLFARMAGVLIALGFSSVPLFVLVKFWTGV